MESAPIPFREPSAPPGTPPLLLFFEERAIKDEIGSRNGPPVYHRAVFIRVIVAGSNDGPTYEICRVKDDGSEKIDQAVYKRFGTAYEAWKKGQEPSGSGTPLEQWPLIDVAMIAAFKAAHVYTVQDLAGLSDSALDQNIRRGGREWRAKAQMWIDQANAGANGEMAAKVARLEEALKETQDLLREALRKQNAPPGFDRPKRKPREPTDGEIEAALGDEGKRL